MFHHAYHLRCIPLHVVSMKVDMCVAVAVTYVGTRMLLQQLGGRRYLLAQKRSKCIEGFSWSWLTLGELSIARSCTCHYASKIKSTCLAIRRSMRRSIWVHFAS